MVARSRRTKPTPIGAPAAVFPEEGANSSGHGAAKRNSAGRPRGRPGGQPNSGPELSPEPQCRIEEEHAKEDLFEYQKKVAHQLLDALDEDSLLSLANFLQSRGLIRRLPSGLEVVPSVYARAQAPEQERNSTWNAASAATPSVASVPAAPVQAASEPSPEPMPEMAESQRAQSFLPETASAGLGSEAGACEVDESNATTLILRNLPPNFSQQAAQEWVDEGGYKGLYDFLLWFPAKKTSRLNTSSYAFVNFRCSQDAMKFRQAFHLFRFSEADTAVNKQWPLSIAIAKIQGFVENFLRFYRLTDERSPTLCQPYFDPNAISKLPLETQQEAAAACCSPSLDGLQEGPCTTLIIRNLPQYIESHDAARQWLDEQVDLVDQYDFFCFFPAKRRRPDSLSNGQGLGYAFVNFKTTETAIRCAELLNGKSRATGDPVLNVVAARVQGLEQCRKHFSSLSDNGRVVLWMDQSSRACARQYQ